MSGAAIYVIPSFSIGNVDSVSKLISARRDRQKGRVWALLLCSLFFFYDTCLLGQRQEKRALLLFSSPKNLLTG